MELSPFRIERFYAQYEQSTRYMLSSSECESRTIAELLELEPDAHGRLLEQRCGYTESPGAPALRAAIASLYERTGAGEVIVTSCAEEGIFLLYHAFLRPGDHAIVETPCYESALEGAHGTGAEVSQWRRRYEDGWPGPASCSSRARCATSRTMSASDLGGPTCPKPSGSSKPISPDMNDATPRGHSAGRDRQAARVGRHGAFMPPESVPDWD